MTADNAAKAGRREWAGLAVLALPTLLMAMDFTVLYLALPRLSTDLGTSGTQQLWIVDIYGFMIAGFLVTMGTLGDRIGRRRLLLAGAAVFGLASVLAAYAASPWLLIVARGLMGVAGATVVPSTLALIGNMFTNPRQRAIAVAVWMSCFQAGMAIGPLVGGALLSTFWWGSVFLLGAPVMALLLFAGPKLLPEFRDTTQPARPDLTSVALSLVAILPFIYGLTQLGYGDTGLLPILAVPLGVAAGVLFVMRQRSLASPLVDLGLFRNRSFTAALVVYGLPGVIGTGSYLFINLYLQSVGGLSPLTAGLLLTPAAAAMIAGSMLAPVLARRIRPSLLIVAGLVVAAVGHVLLTQVDAVTGVPLVVAGYLVTGLGVGPMTALIPDLVVGAVAPTRAGSAASLMQTSGELGLGLGVALLGSLGGMVYRDRLADTVPPGLPASAADAAHRSIDSAVDTATHLPGTLGPDLLAAARAAFTTGLNVVGAVCAAAMLLCALIAAVTLRHVQPTGSADAPQVAQPDPDRAPQA